jgi:transcriptional regulator with XRE-family HTH domain
MFCWAVRSSLLVPPTALEGAFGQVIRELRHEADLSQEALSFACGRHRTYVSLIERGRTSPSIDTLWRLASALHVAPHEIVARVEGVLAPS